MTNLLIWRRHSRAMITFLSQDPQSFEVDGHEYIRREEYFGDYDFLLNKRGDLIGVAFILNAHDQVFGSPLVTHCENVQTDPGFLRIFFRSAEPFQVESMQAMFTAVYRSRTAECALLLPEFSRAAEVDCWTRDTVVQI